MKRQRRVAPQVEPSYVNDARDPNTLQLRQALCQLETNWKEIMKRWEEKYGDTLPPAKSAGN